MLTIAFLLVLSFGWCFISAGKIPRNSLLYKQVEFKNGSIIPCLKITATNRCPPGHEIEEECDYWGGPMKCVPCRPGYYQCDYITTYISIKCYQKECPELGKETKVNVTKHADGGCRLDCVCDEANGYTGDDPTDCQLQKPTCGKDTELKHGVCVACGEGYYNPNRKFGRCIPQPTTQPQVIVSSNVTTTTSGVRGRDITTPGRILSVEGSKKSTTPETNLAATEKSSYSGYWILGITVAVILSGILITVLKSTGIINFRCSSGVVHQQRGNPGETDPLAQEESSSGSSSRDPMNVLPETNTSNGDPRVLPNGTSAGQVVIPCPEAVTPDPDSSAQTDITGLLPPQIPNGMTGLHSNQDFNIVMIYAKEDDDVASEIRSDVNGILLNNGKKVNVLDFYHPSFGGCKINIPRKFISIGNLVLVVVTNNISKDADCRFMIEEAIALTRLENVNKRTYCVRPLHTQPIENRTYSIPDGLSSVSNIDWFGPNRPTKLKELLDELIQT